MRIWTAPSVRTCFKNSMPEKGDCEKITINAARGEFVSFQALIRNEICSRDEKGYNTEIITKSEVFQTKGENFDVSSVRVQTQEYISFNDEIAYPDALSNNVYAKILPNVTQSFWITFPIPYEISSGEYEFEVKFFCNNNEEYRVFAIVKIFNVEIPKSSNGEYLIEHFHTPEDIANLKHGGFEITPYSEKWWEFMQEFARSLREVRSNVYRIYPINLLIASGTKRISETEWNFNFEIMEKMVKFLTQTNTVKAFAIDDPLAPVRGRVIYMIDENGEITEADIASRDAEIWAEKYFTALNGFIKKCTGNAEWIMHIQDEPEDADIWTWAYGYAKKYMPGIRLASTLSIKGIAKELDNKVDIYIPAFGPFEEEKEFYENLAVSGKEVWAYCCCQPEEIWYLNRFIDRPSIQSRLIAWATYSRHLTGFLHYGYSYWQKTPQFYRFGVQKFARFKGDSMLIYPSPEENSIKISIRYINFRDGAQDFELLKIAERKDEEKVRTLAREIASGYTEFSVNEENFMKVREEILKIAEK